MTDIQRVFDPAPVSFPHPAIIRYRGITLGKLTNLKQHPCIFKCFPASFQFFHLSLASLTQFALSKFLLTISTFFHRFAFCSCLINKHCVVRVQRIEPCYVFIFFKHRLHVTCRFSGFQLDQPTDRRPGSYPQVACQLARFLSLNNRA